MLIGRVALFLEHEFILVVKQEHVWPMNKKDGVVRRMTERSPADSIVPALWVEAAEAIHLDVARQVSVWEDVIPCHTYALWAI